jgi:hypothetical protein
MPPHQERRPGWPRTTRHELAVARLIIRSREIDLPVTQQGFDDLHGFSQAVHLPSEVYPEGLIHRLVIARVACAQTQDQAPVAHLVEGRRHLRQDGRMAEGIDQDQRAQLHSLGRFGQGREHRPAFPHAPGRLSRSALEEVVREPEAIEAVAFRLLGDGADRLIRLLAVGFTVVRQDEVQPNFHGVPSAFARLGAMACAFTSCVHACSPRRSGSGTDGSSACPPIGFQWPLERGAHRSS